MSSRSALRNRRKRSPKTDHATERRLSHQTLERRELLAGELGPQLISISANSGENFRLTQQNVLRESPTQLTFRFDGSQQLDPATLAAISIQRSGGDGSFAEGNEIRIDPGFLGFGESNRIVVARFAEGLPDDTYRISIAGYDDTNAGIVGLRNSDGELLRVAGATDPARPEQQVQFRLEFGPQVVAVVPQPITGVGASRMQHRNQIHVFFNEDPLSNPAAGPITTASSTAAVVQTKYYNLFFTDDKVENTAHLNFNPSSVTYDPALNRAVLTFANDISDFAPGGAGTFRLRVGSAQDLPAAPVVVDDDLTSDVGGTFSSARNLNVSFDADPQSILISGEIEASPSYAVQWPGIDAPGTRDHRRDPQVIGQPDSTPGINLYYYNFADAYGLDPFGNVLDNAITDAQRQRTREILALYSQHLGVQFIETENRGLQIVTGDLRALVRPVITGPGEPLHEFRLNDQDPTQGVLVLDSGENWYDGYGLSPNNGRPSWFVEALRGIGSLLGIGHTFDQVPGVASGSNPALYSAAMFPLPNGTIPTAFSIEPDFLSTSDIIPGQALHRPEIRDVDLYRFNVAADGRVAIETFAQRLDETSTLDTEITLWKFNQANNRYDIVARNDDFYSNDSFIGVEVSPNADGTPARYYVGITAAGNQDYNPNIENSGLGGRTQGLYEMRITFQNTNVDTIRDVNGTALDGDGNGVPGGDFNFWFRTAKIKGTEGAGESRTLFVDKSGVNNTSAGTLVSPYRTIAYAFLQSRPGDIVRILPSAGVDGLIDTVGDNLAYEIGRGGPTNAVLSDGETFNVPRGVTVMIDAGTIIKMRNAKISVGSSRVDDDRSLAALQVLGTPVMLDHNGVAIGGEVVFTSYQDESFGVDTNPLPTTPAPGQWAGIEFRNDFDYSEGRPVWETEGIFLDYVAHADIRYGGGSIAATEPIVNPLQMLDARPTIIHNSIRFSSDAAISADPNSFAETNFHAPIYQRVTSFTSDYDRVGPDIRGNRLVENSINGLFVRVRTPAAGEREPMTVSGRFDDFDITHVISEVLVLQGQPGGPLLLESRPDVLNVNLNNAPNPAPAIGTLTVGQVLNYRVTFVTRDGVESLASLPTDSVTVGANQNIRLTNLPQATEDFSGRRLYRLDSATGNYVFVTQLDRNTTTYTDTGKTRGGLLSGAAIAAGTSERLIPRFDARLSIDPGLVIKLDSARIEAGVGADFYAEGIDGKPVVFTSRLDDEYGAGGTFDTNNDGSNGVPQPGGWAGLVFRQGSTASLDHAIVRYAGGGSSVSGGFATFNPIEILQADVRIANSVFSDNASGNAGDLDFRDGIGFNGEATIFVRGAQPTIVNNTIRENLGAAISINPDSLNYLAVQDKGRSTGNVDLIEGRLNNQGPLVVGNRLDGNGINGMLIRQEALTTESVWDDTDIVHVLEGQVYAWNHHQRSGLRLKSAPDESLVVKSLAGGGINAARYLNDVEDSIGGTLQVIGTPGFPVVLTSINDSTVGAGFTPAGQPQNDTLGRLTGNSPAAGDWQGIRIAPGANDRNVAFVLENEPAVAEAAGLNAIPSTAQVIGSLATNEYSADENRRLGFNIRGTLSSNSDIDVYSFFANGQTEVYLDIDDTHFGLDTVVELIDVNGNILALSSNSEAESTNRSLLVNNIGPGAVLPLFKTGQRVVEGPNAMDAGMRVLLPGNSNSVNQYFVRVRSSNLAPGNLRAKLVDPNAIGQGRSQGQYQLSVRLRESDEIAGSTVRLADIRYATHAIDVSSSPFDSPLAAEFAERLQVNGLDVDGAGNFTNAGAQNLGSLNSSHRNVLRVSGFLGNNVANPAAAAAGQDIDVYRVDLFDERLTPEIIGENRFVTAVFDIDYADQLARANTRLSIFDFQGRLILHGLNSNVADDQGRPRFGNDMANLAGGSAGTLDSYIGPVELQEGTYFVVVSSAQMTPQALDQFFNSGATDTNVRMLPLDSVRRIAEESFDDSFIGVNQHFSFTNIQQLNTTAELPPVVPLFDETSIVPYTLEDVRMFVTLQGGLSGSNQTTVITVDPFTGQMERTVGQFGQPVGDVAMRRDGELFAYSLGPETGNTTNGNTGNFLNISPINAAVTNIGDDGLDFRRSNQDFNNTEVVPADQAGQLVINAMAFVPQGATSGASIGNVPGIPGGERMHVVGNRRDFGRGLEIPPELRNNIMYSMVANTGAATNRDSTNANADRNFDGNFPWSDFYGPASNKQEFGIVDVGQFADSDPDKTGGFVTGLAQNQNVFVVGAGFPPGHFAVTDAGGLYSFNRFDTRTPIGEDGTPQFNYTRVINTTFHGTVERHDEHLGPGAPEFASVALGPRATEGGRYNDVFFATTTDGWVYTFQIDVNGIVEPAPVLVHGRSAVQIISAFGFPVTAGRNVTGVAFSIREENPWHQTNDRNTPFGIDGPNSQNNQHGVFEPHNQTRIRTSGGSSLYFGFEPTASVADNTINNDGATGNLAPGGAHGTTVSRPFSLEGYSSADQPTMYFNYFLETQGDSDATLTRRQLDSFRVFATGDDGQWQLLATNNSFRNFLNSDEYDYFAETGIPVQELYDNTDVWRQARIDLSPLAGNKNVQLRFDFSTAGGMQNQFRTTGYLTEIQAVPGRELVDGSGFSLRQGQVESNNFLTNFQLVRGASINLPAGDVLFNGQVISVVGSGGTINLTLTLDPPTGPEEIQFDRADSAADIADRVAAALQSLDPALETVAAGATVRIPEALSFELTPERFAALAIEIPTDVSSLQSQPLVLTDLLGNDTTVSLETTQDVSFTVGGQTVTVTVTNLTGFFDGYQIRFVNNPFLGDVAPTAAINLGQRTITVTYNALAATPTNSDFDAVVTALDNLAFFSAALTAGDGTVAFTPPTPPPRFPTGETYYSLTSTPEQVAVLVANAINNSPRIRATANGRQIVILGAAARSLSGGYVEQSFNQGTTNSQRLANGAYPIFYHSGMTRVEVRDAIRVALANGLGVQHSASGISQATVDNYPGYATNRVRVFEQSVTANSSAIGFSRFLPGDEFGSFGSTNISTDATTGALTRNSIEGVYIDDIVIGFASRGEVVLNAPANQRNFVIDPTYRSNPTLDSHQPEFPDEILVGGYTLEVRTGPNYGVPHDYDPIRLGLNEQRSWGRSFDVNDRLNPGAVTLVAPSGRELTDGQTFVISNGNQSLTFEFDSDGVIAQGNVRVPFTPLMNGTSFDKLTDRPAEVARAIRDAINSTQARSVLGITAAGGDSSEVGPMTGNRIELFGDVIHINPSSGRFLTVDMVAESTPYGSASFRALPRVDHVNETVDNFFLLDPFTLARTTQYLNNATQFEIDSISETPNLSGATVTGYRDGQTDTLVAKGKIGDTVVTGLGNERIASNPQFDVDVVKIYLNAGDTIDALVETNRFNRGAPFRTPQVQIFANDAGNILLADSVPFDPFNFADPDNPFGFVNPVPLSELEIEARIESFLAPTSGYYFLAVSSLGRFSGIFDPSELIGQYQLTVRPSGLLASEPVAVEYHLEGGDVNVFRPQGQLIIESNFISDFAQAGVNATYAGPQIPGIAAVSPLQSRPGGAAMLRNQNTERLIPGTVIMNNVVTATQGTGIVFSGANPVGGQAPAPVPFGRIINNTVVGSGAGIGINVTNSTSPTVLNNVISGFTTGLNIDASSASTVENGNAFQDTTAAASRPLASQSFVIPSDVPLFENPQRRLYIPASGSAVIDSSFANLNDRATFFNTVKQPMGISASPILAPTYDAYGIPRVDDPNVTTPGGIGGNVFIDRGGIDRSDLVQPTAVLVSPIDFIVGQGVQAPDGDNDPDASFVRLPEDSEPVNYFEIQLLDPAGTGPDAATINERTVILTENGVTLVPGVDYTFGYSDNRRLIRLTPLSGLWRPDAVYEITLNNRDRVSLTLPRGELITDGEQYIVTDGQGRQSVFEFDSGFVMQVPQTLAIEVLGPNTFFNDGDVFSVVSPSGVTRTFEINLSGAVASGNIPINLSSAGTVIEIRDAIIAALAGVAETLNLAPVAMTSDTVQVGSLLGHTITGNVAGLRFFGVAGGVSVGDRFRYQTGDNNVLFEFTDGISPVGANTVAITLDRTDSVDQVAEKIAGAVATVPLGLGGARAIGDGLVVLGGAPADRLDVSDSELNVIGVAGVTGSLQLQVSALATAADLEGSTFEVRNGNVLVNFVLTTNTTLVTPNRRVVITPTSTPAQIASAIAAEIVAGFSGALPATSNGRWVMLNEQASIIPAGTAQVLTRISTSTPLLGTAGVSGGAIAVPFIPTRQFSPAAAAAALTIAVATSPLQVTTFTPGGGTLLFDNTALIERRTTAGVTTVAGIPLPAVTDLAGNEIESNRNNDETRFTITMPEVRFDFGDAPASYGTLLADNGARHSVGANALPRLGRVVDTEPDGQPFPASDDAIIPVTVTSPGGSALFGIATLPPVGAEITISSTVAPSSGDRLRVAVGSDSATFELVAPGVASLTGNIPVALVASDTPMTIAAKLAAAITGELAPTGRAVKVEVDENDPIIRIETLDDEDGVAIGQINVGFQSYFVFLDPAADPTAPTPNDVLGFLNPLDPSGTAVAVTVTGAGLLDAWVDFNGDGVFDPTREQVLQNKAVVDGVNILNIATPPNAVAGTTWIRFRLSTTGNLRPTGSAVGGEVEDYRISIIPVAPFEPVDDTYSTIEDTELVVTPTSPEPPLMDNDLNLNSPFLPPRVVVVDEPANGTLTIDDPLTGSFTYVPNTAFNGVDTFTYRLSSEGDARGAATGASIATVTINVAAVNDPPTLNLLSPIDVLERDDSAVVTLAGVITNALPGRPEAVDELASQTVTITIDPAASTMPASLFLTAPAIVPILNDDGVLVGADLQFVQRPDAFGTALVVINVRDDHPTDPQTVVSTVTINIRPVNDAPRLNPAVLGATDNQGDDNVYLVGNGADPAIAAGTILYTSAEDQTLFIPLRRPTGVIGFNRIGLLDVFTPGPENELQAVDGGNQVLELSDIPSQTSAGGTLAPVLDSLGELIGFHYTPPQDFNSDFGGLDSFPYTVIDNNPLGGETWDLAIGGLVDDRLMTQGFVQLRVNPVNDPPQFNMATNAISVLEDSGPFRLTGFAFDIFAGPPETAFDEIDPVTGQKVTFSVSGLTAVTSQLFAAAPVVSPTGVLTFTPAADAFGTAVLEVRATDDGPDNAIRGDVVSSPAQTLTINIRPVNDRPVLNTTTPIVYTLNEDATILQPDGTVTFQGTFIPLNGNGGQVGLLDVFDPGPPNESANVTPGGNQTLRLTTPIPASTAQGGTLTRIFDPADPTVLIGLRYTPRTNFNGTDSFIYGVIDNGVSADLDGVVFNDPREAFNTVTLNVLALNDRPQFSGALSVVVEEDATTTAIVGQSIIPNFVTDIAAGPPGALDELDPVTGQTVTFVVTPLAGNPSNLFSVPPTVSSDGTLTFRTVQDANGVAVFTIFAQDDGPNNPPLEFNTSTPLRTFTITVTPVNDPPTFIPVGDSFTVAEDSGPFTTTEPYATAILPGPPDEVAAGQTVRFEVTVPSDGQALFQTQPNVTDNGFFRFTPRDNAVGSTVVAVVAIDSEGARSEPALVTITITEVNDVPVAGDVTLNSDEDTLLVIPAQTLLDEAFDPDLETNPDEVLLLTAVATTSQAGASVTVLPSGDLQYDPRGSATLQALRPGQTLPDTFTYQVIDAAGAISNVATVTINVAGVNDAPTVRDDFVTLAVTGSTTIRPLDNDFDVDGTIDPLTLRIKLLPAFGSVAVQNDGSLIYTPFDNFRGIDTIRYTVADDLGLRSEQATITIDTNLPPVAVNDNAGTFRGRAVEIDVAANDSDPDGELDLDSIQIVTAPTRGTAIVLGNGIVRYVPGSDFVGTDTFEYTIADTRGRQSNVGQVRIQVVASELQNPNNFTDVNASGETSPLDALLILNRLARAAREGIVGGIPVEMLLDETPRLFYDVDGSRLVEPLDALRVITEIARQNRAALGEGEQAGNLSAPTDAPLAPPATTVPGNGLGNGLVDGLSDAIRSDVFQGVYGPTGVVKDPYGLVADFGLADDDIVDVLAIDSAKQDAEQERSEMLEAIDAAWTDAAGM